MDQRRHVRFALRAPVSFLWGEREGGGCEGNGFTQDISECGIFVLTNTHVPLGTRLRLEIVFRGTETQSVLRMTANAQVLRIEPSSGSEYVSGFAAETSSLVFSTGIVRIGDE